MKIFKLVAFTFTGFVLSGIISVANASVSFNNQAAVTFNLDGIYEGVIASGNFYQEIEAPGDEDGGVINANNPDSSLSLGEQHHFNVASNELVSGSIYASYIGRYQFSFENQSSNAYDLQLSVTYDLSTVTTGQDSTLIVDFSDEFEFFDPQVYLYAYSPSNPTESAIGIFEQAFSLGSTDTKTFFVDIYSGANLYAAPVPVPAAFWTFFSGLMGMVALRKRKLA